MEDIDGGLHPAVDGQSLDEMRWWVHLFILICAFTFCIMCVCFKTPCKNFSLWDNKVYLTLSYLIMCASWWSFNWARTFPHCAPVVWMSVTAICSTVATLADNEIQSTLADNEIEYTGRQWDTEYTDRQWDTVADNEIQSTPADNEIQITLADNEIQSTSADNEIQSTLADNEIQSTLVDDEIQSTLADDEIQSTLADDGIQ